MKNKNLINKIDIWPLFFLTNPKIANIDSDTYILEQLKGRQVPVLAKNEINNFSFFKALFRHIDQWNKSSTGKIHVHVDN